MNIGTAASLSGLPAKTIRYYEEIGLVRPERSENGYRHYSDAHVHKLAFVQRARNLGFSVAECRQLLALYEDTSRASADVRAIAEHKSAEIERRIAGMMQLKATLDHLIACCHGDERPDCPIIDELAHEEPGH